MSFPHGNKVINSCFGNLGKKKKGEKQDDEEEEEEEKEEIRIYRYN